MAESLKILGQAALGGAAALYTVPAATVAVAKTIIVCNQDAATQTFSIWMVKSGDARAIKNKIFTDTSLLAGESVIINPETYLAVGDAIHMSGSSANMGATASGVELDA
jgi:hypothetical protein